MEIRRCQGLSWSLDGRGGIHRAQTASCAGPARAAVAAAFDPGRISQGHAIQPIPCRKNGSWGSIRFVGSPDPIASPTWNLDQETDTDSGNEQILLGGLIQVTGAPHSPSFFLRCEHTRSSGRLKPGCGRRAAFWAPLPQGGAIVLYGLSVFRSELQISPGV